MSGYRGLWWSAVAGTAGVGLVGASRTQTLPQAVALSATLGAFGAILGLAAGQERPHLRRPVLTGALLLGALGSLLPGLLGILGPAALVLLALLVLTSPVVTRAVRRRVRSAPRRPAGIDVGPAQVLRRRWITSGHQLEAATSVEDVERVVQLRAMLLDQILQESDGPLPPYVWAECESRRRGSSSP